MNDAQAAEALDEAFHWLEREGLLREDAASRRLAPTRSGRELQGQGVNAVVAMTPGARELATQLHPRLGPEVRDALTAGVNRSGIALEDAVRALTTSSDHDERLLHARSAQVARCAILREIRTRPTALSRSLRDS